MGWSKWITWLHEGFKKYLPPGIAKKVGVVTVAGLASYGTVQLGVNEPVVLDEPNPLMLVIPDPTPADAAESWLQRRMNGARQWIGRHPAIAGTVAGCAAGSFVPIIGTALGCVSGATVGYTIGSDERDAAAEAK